MTDTNSKQWLTRRQLVQRGAAATTAMLLTACVGELAAPEGEAAATAERSATATTASATTVVEEPVARATAEPTPPATATLEPTPACDDDDDDPTIAQTEGPYYTPSTPQRTNFLEDGPGTRIVVAGRVLTTGCQPIASALIDFWHADDVGEYDNAGYRFRGHQFTNANGNYRLETIVPGLYPGRTRHFHVKVQGPNTALLTTQLYFPGEPGNDSDALFHPALVMTVEEVADGLDAAFDFVLA